MYRERQTKLKLACLASPRSVRNVRLQRPRGKPRLKVSIPSSHIASLVRVNLHCRGSQGAGSCKDCAIFQMLDRCLVIYLALYDLTAASAMGLSSGATVRKQIDIIVGKCVIVIRQLLD
jgi:hypothetical protein